MKNTKRENRYSKHECLSKGYRSGLELRVAKHLEENNIDFEYETKKIEYKIEETKKYTPDFILPNGIIVEAKGFFSVSDRKKHKLLKQQHPELDIRFVFDNSKNKINKGSKTTYAMWCEKQGFKYSDKLIPKEWLEE